MSRLCSILAILGLLAPVAGAGEVWKATFDTDADGVVDVYDNNPDKAMIGPVSGGKLQVNVESASTFPGTDRAGRPLGIAVDGHSQFSALYTFSWSQLNETSTPRYGDQAGFTVSGGGNPGNARGVIGALMQHWKAEDDYYMYLLGQWGTTYGQDALSSPAQINLGPDPYSQTYQLAISYFGDFLGDTGSMLLDVSLFDAQGNLLGVAQQFGIDGKLPWNVDPVAKAAALTAIVPTHLGWIDYAFPPAGRVPSTWLVDSLAFYDTAEEALANVVPEPGAAALLLAGAALTVRRKRRAG